MTTTNNDPFLGAAYRIGVRICRDAIWAGNKCNWVGPSMEYLEGAWKTVQRAYPTDIYSGTCGIGYFLSRLYSFCGDAVLKKTALGCFEQAIANAEQTPEGARIGFYTGWAGMAYVLQECGALLEADDLLERAVFFAGSIERCRLPESGVDILAGSAGAIPVLIGRREGLGAAEKIADHLVQLAHKNGRGWSWNTLQPGSSDATRNLAGFSHGTAGIAWAFTELYDVIRDEKYWDAASGAFAYERSLFSAEYGNWPDLRNGSTPDAGGVQDKAATYGTLAWCHGAPGIGLSRLRVYDLLADETCRQEAVAAVNSTYNNVKQVVENGQGNFSLCHGVGGNTELLLMAAASFDNPELLAFARWVGMAGIERFLNKDIPWPCGIPGAGESPGLMLGLAGIGYFYLRLFDPASTLSILLPAPRRFNK